MKPLKDINEHKFKRQLIGVDRWYNAGSRSFALKDKAGCLNYFMGVGKTFTAMLIVDRYLKEEINPNIVILVPNEFLVEQWNKELDKFFYKKDLEDRVKLYTADYVLTNDIIIHTSLLIVDELDAFYSTKRMLLLTKKYILYKDILALTATYEDRDDRHLKIKDLIPIIDKIDEKEALKEKYISPYIEFNLALHFTEEEQNLHDKHTEQIREGLSKFGKGGLNLAMQCLAGGKTPKGTKYPSTIFCNRWAEHNGWHNNLNLKDPVQVRINNLWNPRVIFAYSIHLIKAIRKRKELIYTSSSKLDVAVRILEKFEHTKSIVFSQSTVFANNLYTIMESVAPGNSVIYHSQVKTQMLPSPKTGKLIKFGKTRLKRRAISRIQEGLSNHLITSSVLDAGLDIPKLKLGITTSGTQNPRQYKQRKGRPTRLDKDNSESIALIVNLYIANSKEVEWLRTRQAKSDNKIYWINDIEQITYNTEIIDNNINIENI